MISTESFSKQAVDFDSWFDKYPALFISEVEALRDMLPSGKSNGMEIGVGTGRYADALGIREGIEPSAGMRNIALSRGIHTKEAIAERLPYKDSLFDFVLMVSRNSYFFSINETFLEVRRVLKPGGRLIIGFIEKDSLFGKLCEEQKEKHIFFHQTIICPTEKLISLLEDTGFGHFEFSQTLFRGPDLIKNFEHAIPGYGKGSFVTIKAIKK